MNKTREFEKVIIINLLLSLLKADFLRNKIIPVIDKKIRKLMLSGEDDLAYSHERYARYCFFRNLLHAFGSKMDDKLIAKDLQKRFVTNLANNIFLNGQQTRDMFYEEEGRSIPSFLVVSPGQRCNLHCIGCYASSDSLHSPALDWKTFDRILTEKKQLWNSYFTVISGGEPFLWRDKGKNIFDIFEKHNDQFFLVFTNGTLINRKNAKRLAELGNVTPAISVEGFEKEAEERRGKGVYRKILEAFTHLRETGVVYGISVTATRKNAEMIVSDEFIDFYFKELRADYGWLFQYMPIGRDIDFEYLLTPQQRLYLYNKGKYINEELGYDYLDFWNNGYISQGCIAARKGGYFYIDWNGNVTPCVFVPYSPVNINDIYREGGTLNDILEKPFFKGVRNWQRSYGYQKRKEEVGNRIRPCMIRDHHAAFYDIIKKHPAKPIDEPAKEALESENYHKNLIAYDKEIAKILDQAWEKDFVQPDLKLAEHSIH